LVRVGREGFALEGFEREGFDPERFFMSASSAKASVGFASGEIFFSQAATWSVG
jgi:hypothetical protein